MRFLKQKFADQKNYIDSFLDDNTLKKLSKPENEQNKASFVQQFIEELIRKNILDQKLINTVNDTNAWSIDFPSWHGEFDEKLGKRIFIIGSEPHIHHKYLQTVYGLHNEKSLQKYITTEHAIFRFVSELVASKYSIEKEEALTQCYFTDLFPLSPYRGSGLKVGSSQGIQKVIGNTGEWVKIRYQYAKENLPLEIASLKP
jgi:hypothetical protein